ncbi:glycoside hydrolase [Phaeosphaeriaceae sp. SRC1lsM3a]|nr:glycoside hydrolase [Stagonospora sp. SRC1lsM3a]
MLSGAYGIALAALLLAANLPLTAADAALTHRATVGGRERVSINAGWRFQRFTSNPDSLSYSTLKSWILPSGNDFIKSSGSKKTRPTGSQPGANLNFTQASFNDAKWEAVNIPHDWAIKGPFNAPGVSGAMGRLPSNGVGWYRRVLPFSAEDAGKTIFLDVDGAMSYAAVWLNGNLVGGWPYGYASFRLDLTPYFKAGTDNILAIRLDNALDNSRWYPGAGIYRNIWLVKSNPVHVAQYGTFVTTPTISSSSATVSLTVDIENKGNSSQVVDVVTEIRPQDQFGVPGSVVTTLSKASATVAAGGKAVVSASAAVANPKLWGPKPNQTPNLYVAITRLSINGQVVDTYETPFGIRTITYDKDTGISVNGQKIRIQGTCNHHDLGSLGTAFNYRAQERQFQMLQEMGNNALRTSHNPPAPEFLELADRMGLVVLDEIFDCWKQSKTKNDFSLIFDDWHEPDLRLFIRRDRNHPSIIAWSFGNEIPEQQGAAGGTIGAELRGIIRDEDSTRQTTAGMNSASPDQALSAQVDIIGLNYNGEGIGVSTSSAWPGFRSKFPNKMMWGTETSSCLSSRGTFVFPVTSGMAAVVSGNSGGGEDTVDMRVSAYDLYSDWWASGSPDKVFSIQDQYPYVAGEFVWTGWDYLGEPTPFNDKARSSYFGIIDMAGFKKDRFYLYQARWAPDVRMAHILPHWTWPDRVGQVTPVHVYSSADEAELFVNGKSAGRLKRGASSWRFRWDKVVYQPGDLKVITYKNGQEWATDTKKTVGNAAKLVLSADRSNIKGDGLDLSFITARVVDANGETVPRASNSISFSITGPGLISTTDNGDPADFTVFSSLTRKAFSGLALAIIRSNAGAVGNLTISAASSGLTGAMVTVQAN